MTKLAPYGMLPRMNWITGVAATVALLVGILIGWGLSFVGGPSQSELEIENEKLKQRNTLLEQQMEETQEKFLNFSKRLSRGG